MAKEKEPDVGFYFAMGDTPLLIPISQRAKDKLNMPRGADCAIFIGEHPYDVLRIFGDGYIFSTLEEYTPVLIAAMTIKQLH